MAPTCELLCHCATCGHEFIWHRLTRERHGPMTRGLDAKPLAGCHLQGISTGESTVRHNRKGMRPRARFARSSLSGDARPAKPGGVEGHRRPQMLTDAPRCGGGRRPPLAHPLPTPCPPLQCLLAAAKGGCEKKLQERGCGAPWHCLVWRLSRGCGSPVAVATSSPSLWPVLSSACRHCSPCPPLTHPLPAPCPPLAYPLPAPCPTLARGGAVPCPPLAQPVPISCPPLVQSLLPSPLTFLLGLCGERRRCITFLPRQVPA